MSGKTKKIVIALALATALAGVVLPASAGKKSAKKTFNVQGVWPLPPEKARFRFQTFIYGTSDIAGKKGGFLDNLAGIKRDDFSPPFMKPYGLASDSKHRLYVADTAIGVVFVMDREHKKVTYIGRGESGRLIQPIGITVDKQDRLWVADVVQKQVFVYDGEGTLLLDFGQNGEFESPTGVAVDDARHRVYVADSKKHCVLVLDDQSGKVIHQIGERGTEHGNFNFPTNLALDKQGQLYVVDTGNWRVQIFSPDFKFVDTFGRQGVQFGDFLRPKGIAIDSYGNVYVVDSDFNNFQVFDSKRRLLMFIGSQGVFPGQFRVPAGIFVDADNNVYVTDQDNKRVVVFKLLDGAVQEPDPGTAVARQQPTKKLSPNAAALSGSQAGK